MKNIRWKLFPICIALVTLIFACPTPVIVSTDHTVTFDKNDDAAAGAMAPQTIAQGVTAALSPCGFVKPGWTFAGWSATPAGSIAYGDGAAYTMGGSDVTLYAQWVANGYSITFDKNDDDASGTMADQVISSGSTVPLTPCAFTKTGWAFSGWATAPAGPVEYLDGADYTMGNADITLHAQWAANNYTVTFEKNDALATGTMGTQTIASGSTAALTACAFAKPGWTFAGWAASPAGPVVYGDGAAYTMGGSDVALYARWVANGYAITFNKNDNNASGAMPDQVISSGSSAALTLCGFAKPGWHFAGWAETSGGPAVYADGATYSMGSANVTLYARWTANNYTITFDKNDNNAIGTMSPQTIASGSSAALTPNAFYKLGWSFDGWAETSGGPAVYADGATYLMGSANVTLYARWTANNYTITFDKNDNDAMGTMGTQTIASGSSAALTACGFSKPGSAFSGWATSSSGAAVYGDGAVYTMGTANVTLYATWSANSYTVTFDKNDASATGTMGLQVIASGAAASLTPNAFTKPGWHFSGWATTPGGSPAYADGAVYTMGTADVTLYAKWSINMYTVTFDSQGGGTVPPQSVAHGSLAAEPGAPTWTEHALEGWFTESSCVNRWNFSSDTITADRTLYAKWLACTEGLAYTLINGNTRYSVGKGSANTLGGVVIPAYWAGKPVTALANNAFQNCSALASVSIPAGVTAIGSYAFYGCSSLTGLTLPAGLTAVADSTFSGCSGLASLTLPGGLLSIGAYAFSNCSALTGLTLPAGVTAIGVGAFQGCTKITGFAVPAGVTAIADAVFSGCSALTSVTLPAGAATIGSSSFYNCTGLTSLTLPAALVSIGPYAFQSCRGLTGLTIPNGVTAIANSAFSGCSALTSLTLPADVTTIGACAFQDCNHIASLIIPDGVTAIADSVFSGCSALTSVTLPAGVTAIGDSAFHMCTSLTALTLPAGVTVIKSNAFYSCSKLASLVIPNGVTAIEPTTFWGCKALASLTLPGGLTAIGNDAFVYCSALTALTLPAGVASIGSSAFAHCTGLTSLTIPNGVTAFADNTVAFCSSLTSVTLPAGLASIGAYAFYSCDQLAGLTIPSGVTSIGHDAFNSCTKLATLSIPAAVTAIGDNAFYACSALTGVTLPSGLAAVGNSLFRQCGNLTTINIPGGVTTIGTYAFGSCSKLASVFLHDGLTSIGDSAFYGCVALTSVTLPDTVTSLGPNAFQGCSALVGVTLSNGLTTVGNYVFQGCSALTGVTLPSSVTAIGNGAFGGCDGLTSVTIPSGVTSVGSYAFESCDHLAAVIAHPAAPPTAGSQMFMSCPLLTAVRVPAGSVSAYQAAVGWSTYSGIIVSQ